MLGWKFHTSELIYGNEKNKKITKIDTSNCKFRHHFIDKYTYNDLHV